MEQQGLSLPGADFVLPMPEGRDMRVLWLSDMQIIDPDQRRYPERLCEAECRAYAHGSEWRNYIYQVDRLMKAVRPDLVLVTGDMTYGSFDDSGDTLRGFVRVMEGYGVPWAPVFGNHDNESAMGIDWQCHQLATAPHCLFRRGAVSGNGNYLIALTRRGRPVRYLAMLDSGGCGGAYDNCARRPAGLAADQLAWLEEQVAQLAQAANGPLPGILAFHVPTNDYEDALVEAGYQAGYDRDRDMPHAYTIGVDVPARNGDHGRKDSALKGAHPAPYLLPLCRRIGVDGVLAGHTHRNNISVLYRGIRFALANKCGVYDYHLKGMTGGSRLDIARDGSHFTVAHLSVEEPIPRTLP